MGYYGESSKITLANQFEQVQEIMVLLTWATSDDSDKPGHPHSQLRRFTTCTPKV